MSDLYLLHIELFMDISFIFIFLLFPYYIMWWGTILGAVDDYVWYMYIPIISHFISILIIYILTCRGSSKLFEYYYRIKYKEKKADIEYRKIIDPYDEEEWGEKWREEIKTNKFYKKLQNWSYF